MGFKQVIVVCRQNMHRSPLLAAELKSYLHGSRHRITSRGILTPKWRRPTIRENFDADPSIPLFARVSKAMGRERQFMSHRPRQLKGAEVNRADLIIAVSPEVKRDLIRRFSTAASKVKLPREIIAGEKQLTLKALTSRNLTGGLGNITKNPRATREAWAIFREIVRQARAIAPVIRGK